MQSRKGPLSGLKIIEFAGIGPGPMTAMLLADLGASVLRIERTVPANIGVQRPRQYDLLLRNRASVSLDLKASDDRDCAIELAKGADAIIEGFRPGTMERLGLGPEVLLAAHPPLVYGRVTGWGQEGPMAKVAGHDINYIAVTGALDSIGRKGAPPTPPLNLLADYAGGGMLLAFGIVSAIFEARQSGQGQVVDAAMIDGAALMMTAMFGLRAAGIHDAERGNNLLDSGAPNYDVYECSDGGYVAVGPLEKKFISMLLDLLEIEPAILSKFADRNDWPVARAAVAARFRTRTRAEWTELFDGTDACVVPVLMAEEAAAYPHNAARQTFVTIDNVVQPAPAPRFSRTELSLPSPPLPPGEGVRNLLEGWIISEVVRKRLIA